MVRSLVLLLSAVLVSLHPPLVPAELSLEIQLVLRQINLPDQRNVVTLSCILTDPDTGGTFPVDQASVHLRDPATGIVELVYEQDACNICSHVTFTITPSTEGCYFCRDSQSRMSAELELAAYPVPNESLTQKVYSAQEGGEVTLPCDFERGRLSNLYTYRWHRTDIGVIFNEDSETEPSTKYVITNDFSLQIKSLNSSDNASYWCMVSVQNPGGGAPFSAQGRVISLEVYDDVKIVRDIKSQAVQENEASDPFTCVAQGTPLPTIQWTFNGSALDAIERFEVTREETGDNEITSTLTVNETQTRDNVEIACVAINQPLTQSELFRASSAANLAVFPERVNRLVLAAAASPDPELNRVFINFELPDPVVGEARLWVKYFYLDDSTNQNSPTIRDYPQKMVGSSRSINFELPKVDWKNFPTFHVQVALTAPSADIDDVMFNSTSNPVTINEDSRADTGLSDKNMYIIIGAVGAVIVVIILIIVVGLVCAYSCKSVKDIILRSDGNEEEDPEVPCWQAGQWKIAGGEEKEEEEEEEGEEEEGEEEEEEEEEEEDKDESSSAVICHDGDVVARQIDTHHDMNFNDQRLQSEYSLETTRPSSSFVITIHETPLTNNEQPLVKDLESSL